MAEILAPLTPMEPGFYPITRGLILQSTERLHRPKTPVLNTLICYGLPELGPKGVKLFPEGYCTFPKNFEVSNEQLSDSVSLFVPMNSTSAINSKFLLFKQHFTDILSPICRGFIASNNGISLGCTIKECLPMCCHVLHIC